MSNIVTLASRAPKAAALKPHALVGLGSGSGGLAPLLTAFAHHRRRAGDAFWLKENAELLGVLAALGRKLPDLTLAAYQPFYESAAAQIAIFPQYYRMILSVITSLEDLGYPGTLGAQLARWIVQEGLQESEVNDMQRAEVRYLLARHDVAWDQDNLDARLMAFISRPDTFALPNPRAAYDLLHVVFYLSNYGRRPLRLPEAALESLTVLGCLAHLEENGDLLAEVCLALIYVSAEIPPIWLQHVRAEAASIRIQTQRCEDSTDGYHNFLVNQWLLGTIGEFVFGVPATLGPMSFHLPRATISPLREFSQALLAPGLRRADNWAALREACAPHVSARALAVADAGAAGSPCFARFIKAFARVSTPAGPVPTGTGPHHQAQKVMA